MKKMRGSSKPLHSTAYLEQLQQCADVSVPLYSCPLVEKYCSNLIHKGRLKRANYKHTRIFVSVRTGHRPLINSDIVFYV